MATSRSQRDRARARQQAHESSRRHDAESARRRRRVVGIVGAVVLLAVLAGLLGSRATDTSTETATSSSTSSSTTPVTGLRNITPVAPGEQLTTATTCPPEDGSAPRVTSFADPPPTCIDPSRFYEAIVETTAGNLTLQLNPQQAPSAVNNFVVLALYHFYDGQPFTTIVPRQSASVEAIFDNPPGVSSPGYTLPSEVPPQGQIFVPGSVAMIPEPGAADDAYGGAFLLATFEMAPAIPQSVTQFGIMLDGQDVLKALENAASQSGEPTELLSITGIRIRPTVPID